MDKCPLCNGTGRKFVKRQHPLTKRIKMEVDWCLCKKSEYVSSEYFMVQVLGDTYIPLEEIDEELIFLPYELKKSSNFLIRGTDFQSFCLHIKGVLMKYLFYDPTPTIYLCKAFDILKKFYVEQEDRTNPQLADLNKYDLLIFTLDTKQKNEKLNACVHEVVYNRLRTGLPTWIYLPEEMTFETTTEYTDELKIILNDSYKKITLAAKSRKIEPPKNKVKHKAEGFKPSKTQGSDA